MEQFKKAKVVLLPIEKYAPSYNTIIKCIKGETPKTKINQLALNLNPLSTVENVKWETQHLYIISDDEIISTDYWFNLDRNDINSGELWDIANTAPSCKKIIASYPSLKRETNKAFINKSYIPQYIKQPQPTQQFIEQYIKSYNKGKVITDILVEYITCCEECGEPLTIHSNCPFGCITGENNNKLKINPDNTITIKPLKNSWNREEVIELLDKVRELTFRQPTYMAHNFKDWINQNL